MKRITSYIQSFSLQNVPEKEQLISKYILLDCIGQMSTDQKVNVYEKVFWQSYKLVREEMDEGNALAKGHPACHFVPALLQIAKENEATYEELLEAFICGYEVGARTGEVVTLKNSIHPHANWGVIGGVAALAKLYKWNEEQTENALHFAGQIVFPTLWQPILEGYEARNTLIGFNNVHLLMLKSIVEQNIASSPQTWSIMFNEVIGSKFLVDDWNDDGNIFYVNATYFKFYNSCRFCHGPVDVALKLLKKYEQLNEQTIDSIVVETYGLAARLNNQRPNNAFAGKFSIPYAVAQAMIKDWPAKQQEIYQLAEKVTVIETDEMNQLLPNRGTKMIINSNGKSYEMFQLGALGDQSTLDLFELVEKKFQRNLQACFTPSVIEKLRKEVLYSNLISYEYI